MKHTLAWLDGDRVRLGYKPVVVTHFTPQERVY
jgi:succinate dehydrogenase / fumarate reductase flavoprotein subunit